MARNDVVGRLHVAKVDQFARQDAPLDPPRVGIDKAFPIARRLQHNGGGLREFPLLAQHPGLREEIAGGALAFRHRLNQLGRRPFAADRSAPGVGQRFRSRQAGNALRRIDALGIKHALHADTVICGRDQAAKLADDRRLVGGVELFRSPEGGEPGKRRFGVAQRHLCASKQDNAFDGLRPGAAEGAKNGLWIGFLGVERALAIAAQRCRAGPAGKGPGGCGDVGGRHAPSHGNSPGEDLPVEAGLGQPVADIARLAGVSRRQRVEAALQWGHAFGSRQSRAGHGDCRRGPAVDAQSKRRRRDDGDCGAKQRETVGTDMAYDVFHSRS
jgi:hypothetical protein